MTDPDSVSRDLARIEDNDMLRQVFELRVAGLSLHAACLQLGVPVAQARKAMDKWLAKNPALNATAFRMQELEVMEHLQEGLMKIFDQEHLMTSAGKIVYRPVLDENGLPKMHPTLGVPILGDPVTDHGPRMVAAGQILKLLERKAKMMGSDLPAAKEAGAAGAGAGGEELTPEQLHAGMKEYLRKIGRLKDVEGATDVVSRPVKDGSE